MASEKQSMSKKVKAIIIVLLCLLLLSAGALTARVVYLNYFNDSSTTVIVPDNIIGEESSSTPVPDSSETTDPSESTGTGSNPTDSTEQTSQPTDSASSTPTTETSSNDSNTASESQKEAAVIELYKGQPSDNEKFQVINMLPGDTEVKYFAVKVSHHADVIVYFDAEVTEQTKNLANVLHIKVTHLENGKVIYDGTFADMNIDGYGETFATNESKETVAYYKIEVSLPTSTGNEYQAAKLLADFRWYVEDTEPLDPPQTGDNSNLTLYFILMICSGLMLVILLFTKRKERKVDGNAN